MKCLQKMAGIAMSAVILTSAVSVANVTSVAAAEIIPVYLNGKLMEFPANDAQPQIYQNRTYVPIRKTAEYLGLSINWNSKTETMTFSREGITIDHTMRSNIVYVSGQARTFDTRSINVQNRTLMPIRMLGESIGATVDWDNEKRAVYITTADNKESTETTTAATAAPATTSAAAPQLVSVTSNKTYAAVGEKIKLSVVAKNATKVKLMDAEDGKEIEVVTEYGESADGSRIFEALIDAKNDKDEPVIKSVIVAAGDDTKFYEDIQNTKTINYGVSNEAAKSSSKDDDDKDSKNKSDDKIKSDHLISYKLDSNSYDEDDYATITVVTKDDVEKVRITNNFNNGRSEGSEYTEKNGERTFKVKTRLSKKGNVYLYITLYVEKEGYEAVNQKISLTVGKNSEKSYDKLEIVDVEMLNDTVYRDEEAKLLVYTSTDVKEVAVFNPDDKKVASSYYNSGKEDGKLIWEVSFTVDHTSKEKYTIYAYDDEDNSEVETIKIAGESYSKSDNVVLSVEQKTSNVKEGETCKFSVKTTSGITKIVLATESGKTIATETKGSKSSSYRTFTIKGEIDDLDDEYQIFGYDDSDNKESTYKFKVKGKPTEEVEIIGIEVEDSRVDIDERIQVTVETSTNVKKITIVDQDDYRVCKETEPTEEKSSKYIWELSFYARDDGKNTFTITAEDNDDNTDEWDFNVTVDD